MNKKNNSNSIKLIIYSIILAIVIFGLALFNNHALPNLKINRILNADVNGNPNQNLSNNSSLDSLSVEGFELNETFDRDLLEYSVNVPYEIDNIQINTSAEGTINISPEDTILVPGDNIITITVTAEDESTTEYKLTVIKASRPTEGLTNIILSVGSLSTDFDPEIESYEAHIPENANFEDLVITGECTEGSSISVKGPDEYNILRNVYEITVTLPDTTIKKYYVTVVKDIGNLLLNLEINGATLDKEFDPYVNIYTASANEESNEVTFNYTYSDGARVEFIGENTLNDGDNNFEIKVYDTEDKVNTYYINVRKGKSIIDTLDSIIINNGDINLSPAFNKDITSYQAYVDNSISSITVSATPTDTYSTIEGRGEYNLDVGSNIIELTVTAENTNYSKTYVIRVTRGESYDIPGVVDDSYMIVELNKTAGELKESLSDFDVYVYDTDDTELEDNEKIRTDQYIKINDLIYTLFIKGDFRNDGRININDIQRLYDYLYDENFNIDLVTEAQRKAGEMTNDTRLNINDVQALYDYYMNLVGGN